MGIITMSVIMVDIAIIVDIIGFSQASCIGHDLDNHLGYPYDHLYLLASNAGLLSSSNHHYIIGVDWAVVDMVDLVLYNKKIELI
jgi:hypothetical protein